MKTIQVNQLEVDGKGLRFPNISQERKLISGDRPTSFKASDGFRLSYDPAAATHTVTLGDVTRCVHASRVVWWEPADVSRETVPRVIPAAPKTDLDAEFAKMMIESAPQSHMVQGPISASGDGPLDQKPVKPKKEHWRAKQKRLAQEAKASSGPQ